jgi:uncharacterized protein YcbK (DUF882 family)
MSRFFNASEQRCRCGQCAGLLADDFAAWLDELREELARPLRLTSAYRCPEHDARVGGKGPHTTGRAADIAAVASSEKHAIAKAALALGALGVGVGATFVHVDRIEPGGKFPRPGLWTYPTRG